MFSGLIFAGGEGKRMKNESKAMTKLNGKPLITYAIDALIRSGITNITIIRNAKDHSILSLLKIYKDINVNISFLDDAFQKGIHFSFVYFEKYLTFPIVSLDCDIYFDDIEFINIVKKAQELFQSEENADAAMVISKVNPFNEPKLIIQKNKKIVDYVNVDNPEGYYGGFIFFWKTSPCNEIKEYYKLINKNISFISYYTDNKQIYPISISYLWDIDTPNRIIESEKIINRINNQENDFRNLIMQLQKQKSIKSIALGGSRSRDSYKIDSDFDLFCLIDDTNFWSFKEKFTNILLSIPNIIFAAYAFYLERWGYLFKVASVYGSCFDISILPICRINEMCIRKTNIIVYDPFDIYKNAKNALNENDYSTDNREKQNEFNYLQMFYFEWLRFKKSYNENNYWLALKSIERMKIYYMHMYRIKYMCFANNPHCPENQFRDKNILEAYKIDGTFLTLKRTAMDIRDLFIKTFNPNWSDRKEIFSF